MRIRIVEKVAASSIDTGLDLFHPGYQYEVSITLGLLFLAERWAELVGFDDFNRVGPLDEKDHDAEELSTSFELKREPYPPSVAAAITADIAFDDAIAAAIESRRRRQE
jgi:hypothetical protein